MTEAKAAEDATSLREAAKVAWRVICDAEAVINTLDGECVLETMNLDELRERLAASASVLFCVLRLPMSELTNPTVATPPPDQRIASLEARLRDEQETHAALQSRCYEGFASATDGIFDYLREVQAENAALRADAERLAWFEAAYKTLRAAIDAARAGKDQK